MPRTALIADSADRFDPWGFGTTAADEPTEVLDVAGLTDDDLTGLDAFDPAASTSDADAAVSDLVSRLVALPASPTPAPGWRVPGHVAAVLAVFLLVILGQAFYIGFSLSGEVRASAAPTGELVLSSHPAGARVSVDGADRGVTPLVATVPVGRHQVAVVAAGGAAETFAADVTTAAPWTRHVMFASPALALPPASLRIDAASGAAVWVDGRAAGRAPLTVSDLGAGEHAVRVQFASGIVERRVTLAGGERLSLVLDAPASRSAIPAGPASGWLHVQSSFAVQVYEHGQLVGSSASERILITAGPHVFDLVNEALGFRTTMKVVVGTGRSETLAVDTPRTAVQVNAQPWAEVLVDGRLLGETPLANLMLPIGVHQVVFRHPELGERTQSVTVRLDTPNRVTADLRRQPS